MVRDGFGDESGAKLIEQRGIDFAPSEDFIQTLKAAGASEAFLNALRAAVAPGLSPANADVAASLPRHGGVKPPPRDAALKGGSTTVAPPASAKKPLNQVQVFALLAGPAPSHHLAMLVKERGIDFDANDDYLQEVRLGGGDGDLIAELKSAKVTKPVTVDPAAQAQQTEVRQYAARGAQLMHAKRYGRAAAQYSAALRLDSQNAELHLALGATFIGRRNWNKAIAEEQETIRLEPTLAPAHSALAANLTNKGIQDGAVTEAREAVRLDPENENAHVILGIALGLMDDWEGAISEQRAALRLNSNDAAAHYGLGVALLQKGDRGGALQEYRMACQLKPQNPIFRQAYRQLRQQVRD